MLKGAFTALVTPFNQDGSLDREALKALIKFQLEGGINGLVPVGTTGESPTLTAGEKEFIIQTAVEMAAGRVPVIAGTGSNDTQKAVEATRRARELGADYTLQVTPYYNKPSEEGLYRHFSEVADQGGLPVIVYTVPGRTGVNVSPALLRRLSKNSRIAGVKEASGSMGQILDILNNKPEDFSVLSGDDLLALPLITSGGHGVISVTSNMFPREMVQLAGAALSGNLEEARQIHNRFYSFFINQFIEVNPVPIKTYMAAKGLLKEVFRLPLAPLKEENKRTLLATFDS
ncbi:MAG: 4-hydroxy-tetrahydrodipicolinate synthase [Spirochaetales bacterium]|nr:4-hydroxy-tetrahydrodipicolinate synthase [Spirochaetales bacterium]